MVTLTDKQVNFIKNALEEAISVLEWPDPMPGEEIDQIIGVLDDAVNVLSGNAIVVE